MKGPLFLLITIMVVDIAICSTKSKNEVIDSGLSEDEIQAILDMHNNYRLQVAQGKCSGQPKACGMKKLKWDDMLSEQAQNISDTCVFAHVIIKDERWDYVGQNLGLEAYLYDQKDTNWTLITDMWFDEHKNYTYPDGASQTTGHYTQVVWASTEYIGCGYTYYKTDKFVYQKLYVCNYGPAGNIVGSPPYETKGNECNKLI